MTEKIGLVAVMEMSDFERGVKVYNSSIDEMIGAGDELSASAKSQLVSLTDLAQVLSDASPAKLATTALAQLEQQFIDGKLTASQYADATGQVQDEFGLVTSAGKSAAGTLTELNAKFQAGEISAEEYAEGLKKIDTVQETTGKSAVELAAQMELVSAAYDAVAEAVGEAIELADLGSQANRAEERFRSFAGEVGDADELLAAFNKGAGGTVDKLTAMTSAGRLLQMGLVSNNDEMEQVVEMATRLGDQTQSAGDRVADFAALLANQSIPRLDNFGISSGKVRARIEELQKAFPGMSREVAFSKAVFEQGAVSLDILGTRTQDAGAKMEVARANIENMRIEMGQKLLPIVANLFGVVANLNTNTIAMIAVLGGGVPVLIKVVTAFKAMNAGMDTSLLRMGVLAAGVAALIVHVDNFNNQMDEMGAAQKGAQEAAASLGDEVQTLVDSGVPLADAMAQVGLKVDEAATKFNDARILGFIPLNGVMNASAEFAKTMAEATNSLQGAIISNTDSFSAYKEAITTYNAGVTDSTAKLVALTEAEFRMEEIRVKGASAASLLADEILKENLALDDTGTAADRAFPILDRYNQNQERGAQKAEQMAGAVAENAAQIQASSSVVDANAEAIAARASMEEKAARIEDMQAASALAASAALEEKRKKDIETVQAEQALAQSVLNASDAMIAQTFISGLDPDAMGLTAYRAAVEDIQLAFGLATPESIALAQGINQGIDAINAGDVARDDLEGFVNAIIEDSKDATSSFDTLTREFASSGAESERLAGRIDDTGEAIMNNVAVTEELIAAEEGLDSTTNAIGDTMVELTDLTANVADKNETWLDTISMTDRTISDTQVTTEQWADKMQGLGDRIAATGEDTLTAGEKVAGLNALLERTDDAGADAASGLDAVTESSGETAAALEESTTAVGGLETAMSEAAAAAPGHGAAIGSGLRSGMEPQMDGFVASFRAKLQTLKDQLPSSQPKDTTSPLYGLDESGEAIVGNITIGIEAAGPSAVDAMAAVGESMGQAFVSAIGDSTEDLFDAAGMLGGLGSAAGGLFQARTVGPLEDALAGLEQSAESARQQYEQLGEEQLSIQEALAESSDLSLTRLIRLFEVDPSQLTFEQIFMLSQMNEIMHERQRIAESINATEESIVATTEELVAQQERLARLQQQQENLRFLEQQADLLELIAEKGLDAGAILGGLQLGIDADAGLVMDAMAAAMQQIIEQAEEELGIASPSKVFEQIGRNTMTGMAMGIEELMSLPVAHSALAAQSMVAAPAAIVSQGGSTINNNRTVNVDASGATIASDIGLSRFTTSVKRVVEDSLRGVD